MGGGPQTGQGWRDAAAHSAGSPGRASHLSEIRNPAISLSKIAPAPEAGLVRHPEQENNQEEPGC